MIVPTTFRPGPLRGRISLPGDKSISHRALVIAAAGDEPVEIHNLNPGRDVLATARALALLGATVERNESRALVTGARLRDATETVDCMNSGSTARMLMGVAAGAGIVARFDGDASLRRRPMEPVAAQLRAFGAQIETHDGRLPATVRGRLPAQTRRFILLSPSAQVKTALLFAGLFSRTPVAIAGDKGSRDHTERLLRYWGAEIAFDRSTVELRSMPERLSAIEVAGDFSAAAFFIVAATVSPGSSLTIASVGVNPTRTGLLDALLQMGAHIRLENRRERCGEPIADLVVEHAPLSAISVDPDLALRAIDEIPVLAVAAAFAPGETKITGIGDLRTKESDRVAAIQRLLGAAGVGVETLPNGIVIHGGSPAAAGPAVQTHHDHRIAMAAAALAAGAGPVGIDSEESIDVSFPTFVRTLRSVQV